MLVSETNVGEILERNRQNMQDALEHPEDYLWVRYRDEARGTIIDTDRLYELQDGATPKDETEQVLVADPDWLRIYLRHVIGEYPITILAGGPLPKWSPTWLESVV